MKILLLGHTGKMGTAIRNVFTDHRVCGKGRDDFDAEASNIKDQIEGMLSKCLPDVVVNTVAYMSIDHCEINPGTAMWVNTLFPRKLAELANKYHFTLVHFSTDATFSDGKGDYHCESDPNRPLNVYGFTKFGADCFVSNIAEKYYILRLPVLFGPSSKNTQFVEKMLQRITEGEKVLRIADDIVSSPTYSIDVAWKLKTFLELGIAYGIYHVTNRGMASLYDLIQEICKHLYPDVKVERASYKDFDCVGTKNTFTPLCSEKIGNMRPWEEAVREYCDTLREG